MKASSTDSGSAPKLADASLTPGSVPPGRLVEVFGKLAAGSLI